MTTKWNANEIIIVILSMNLHELGYFTIFMYQTIKVILCIRE